MSYIGNKPESYAGKIVGNGQCVAFVGDCSGAPPSSTWTAGGIVKATDVAKHTAIATFDDNGHYPNNPTGQHAAIFISKEEKGIWVWDQWTGQPVHKRFIQYKGFQGSWSNDADRFSVIEGSRIAKTLAKRLKLEDAICVNLGSLPQGAYGGTVLLIPAASFVAEARPYDHLHAAGITRLESVPADGFPVTGLGKFWELVLDLKPWSSLIGELRFQLVSYAGEQTRCRVLDIDGNIISDDMYPTPQGKLATIVVNGLGIARAELPQSPEVTLLGLCVKTLP